MENLKAEAGMQKLGSHISNLNVQAGIWELISSTACIYYNRPLEIAVTFTWVPTITWNLIGAYAGVTEGHAHVVLVRFSRFSSRNLATIKISCCPRVIPTLINEISKLCRLLNALIQLQQTTAKFDS